MNLSRILPSAAAGTALAGVAAWRLTRNGSSDNGPLRRSLTIARTPDELGRLWQDRSTLSSVLGDLGEAEPLGPDWARFTRRGRFGRSFETDARLELKPGPEDWGTEVTLTLATGGGKAKGIAADKALRRLKSLAETGELPTTERNPAARADAG